MASRSSGTPDALSLCPHSIIVAIAPDLRGFGDTDAPPSPSSYTILLDALGLDKVFLVGDDWGAALAWAFCLLRPDRIKALVNTRVAYRPRNTKMKPVETMRLMMITTCVDFRIGLLVVPKEVGFGGSPNTLIKLPSWLTEEDVNYYANKFNEKSFTGGLNYYRALDLNWELTAPWTGVQIKVPTKFIVGDLDLQQTRCQGLCSQKGIQKRRAILTRTHYNGRSGSFSP